MFKRFVSCTLACGLVLALLPAVVLAAGAADALAQHQGATKHHLTIEPGGVA